MSERYAVRGRTIVDLLDGQYPKIRTPLSYSGPFQLLIATMLSAQCTDAQVNHVTPILFERYTDARAMADANLRDLERIIRSTGFFHVKASRIKEASKTILSDFSGKVPSTMHELITLPGVGRKTANIVLSAGFDRIDGIAVDTHVQRLAKRIGLSKEKSPEKIEQDLMRITPKEMWSRFSLLLILHGRSICNARKPMCEKCVLSKHCDYFKERENHKMSRLGHSS